MIFWHFRFSVSYKLLNDYFDCREIKCSIDASLPSYSGFFESAKHTEIDNTGQVENTRQEGVSLSDMNSLNLQIDDQFAYNPFSNLNLPEAKELNPGTESNLQGNHHVDYQINSNSERPSSIYDNVHHNTWFPESGHCDISIFNDSSYSQVSNPCYFLISCNLWDIYIYIYRQNYLIVEQVLSEREFVYCDPCKNFSTFISHCL